MCRSFSAMCHGLKLSDKKTGGFKRNLVLHLSLSSLTKFCLTFLGATLLFLINGQFILTPKYTGSLASADFSGAVFTHAYFQKISQISSLCHFHYTANIFEVIFTVFNCVPISTVILLYGLHFNAAPSTV